MPGKEWIRGKVYEELLEKQLKEQREEFLADLKLIKVWAKEHVKDAYDPIGSLIDDIDDTLIEKWEGK